MIEDHPVGAIDTLSLFRVSRKQEAGVRSVQGLEVGRQADARDWGAAGA